MKKSSPPVVLETSVLVVANGREGTHTPECRLACIDALIESRGRKRVCLDRLGGIFDEYTYYCNYRGQPGPGDEFYRWLVEHMYTSDCELAPLTSHPTRGYEEFPADPDLDVFDPSDRKFVAVALSASAKAPIINAADSGYLVHRIALERNDVEVVELCETFVAASARRRTRRT